MRRGIEEEEAWAEETTLGDEATSATVIRSPSTALGGRHAIIESLTHGYRTTGGLVKEILGFWLRTIMLMWKEILLSNNEVYRTSYTFHIQDQSTIRFNQSIM